MKLPTVVLCSASICLSSCDRISLFDSAPVAACEKYVQSRVLSKPSYKRLSVQKWTEKISEAELDELRRPSSVKLPGAPSLYFVGIQYKDLNPHGVPLELGSICAFEMRDGELPSVEVIKANASMAESQARLRDLTDAGLVPNLPAHSFPTPKYPCCLN